MPDSTPPPPPAPKSPRSVPHAALDTSILDDLKLAEKIAKAAQRPTLAPALAEEGIPATEATGLLTETTALKALSGEIISLRKAAMSFTAKEETARKAHLAALRQLQNLAKRTFPKDKNARAIYGIGESNFGDNRTTLEARTRAILARAPGDSLPGNPAPKIAAATATLTTWKEADDKQTTAQGAYSTSLDNLRTRTADLNSRRRNIQLAGDNIAPAGSKGSAPIRRALSLPLDKALA